MRHFKQLCAACVLILAISVSAFAGNMETGVTAPPPPPPSQVTAQGDMEAGYAGEMSTGVMATDTATETALNLIESVLSLF